MRAVVTTGAAGGVPMVTERPDPVPGTGEILVSVRAAGINNADLLQVNGHYPAPPGAPADILGLELAGEVVDLGPDVSRFCVGDRVMAVVGGGGQASLTTMPESTAMGVPAQLGWAEAGGFPEAFTTAHDALFTQAGLGPGERVCVHAAAGGVGAAAVQLAAAVEAPVVATVRRPELREAVRQLAPGTIVVDPADFVGCGPFDVILELIGGPNLPDDLAALATGGRIVVIGVGGGVSALIDLRVLMAARGRIQGSTLRSRSIEQKADAARRVEVAVLPLVAERRVRVPVMATFPLSEAPAAYARFAQPGKLGKIVLVID